MTGNPSHITPSRRRVGLPGLVGLVAVAAAAFALSACGGSSAVECPGYLCPEGYRCAQNALVCIADTCGDGTLQPEANEVCDDGNVESGDGCSADCLSDETCGNGIEDAVTPDLPNGEICDDGNNESGDECSADCRSIEVCGNGYKDEAIGEVCDDGNRESGDNCRSDCQSDETCGNGKIDSDVGEQCDDGNLVPGDNCSPRCFLEDCGDGEIGPGEQCDDGNEVSGDGCSATCQDEVCGNGVLDDERGEECDDGSQCADGRECTTDADCVGAGNDEQCRPRSGDDCSATCLREECGNGEVDVGEECDDGGTVIGDGCGRECFIERCGNSRLDPGELCDDGNDVPGDGCSVDCQSEACGNGVIDRAGEVGDDAGVDARPDDGPDAEPNDGAYEECDDGNNTPGDGCGPTCKAEVCGNGVVDYFNGEVCDDNNRQGGDGCSADCTRSTLCGDGVVQADVGEVCDDGKQCSNGASCTANADCAGIDPAVGDRICKPRSGDDCSADCLSEEVCGNAYLDVGEVCDDGRHCEPGGEICQVDADCPVQGATCAPRDPAGDATAGCSADCQSNIGCGNGQIERGFGETCDDGNGVSNDGCSADCLSAEFCGNGYLDAGEACDDGNNTSGDGCSADCQSREFCGNGYPDVGEHCDRGPSGSETCTTDCTISYCGDGITNTLAVPSEQCDDANDSNGDDCLNDCTRNVCGDGWLNPSEEVCDDGNVLACGTCNADCSAAQAAAEHSTAEITVVDAVAVVEASTLTLNDGIFGATVFEFSADSAIVAGRVRIDTSGVNTNDGLRDAIATAINAAPSLLIEATIEPNGVVALRNLYAGEHGDQAIDFSGGAELSVADMSDGLGGRCVADVGCRFDDDCATGFCDLHTDTCAPVTRCGNGVVDPGETCDDGNHRTETECAYGPGQCTHCDATCETSLSLVGPFCGDGAMHPGEDCDDGDARDTGNGCSADCKRNDTCGDGVLESVFESCDDGNADACGTCSANCQTLRAAKAIGSITVVAVNDSPSLDGKVLVVHDGINAATTFEFDTNGALTDGTHRPIMLAPNANRAAVRDAVIAAINHYNAPLFVVAVANGDNDGVIDLEHEFLGDFSPALMTTTAANFEVDGLAGGGGRDCVDGRSCVVGEDCVSGRCAVPPGQVTGFCQATTCGDGRLDIGEQCDDGTRADEGNGCDAVCRRYDVCGDGVLHAEFEVCDDGNTITETQCPYAQTQCTLCDATCRAPLTHQPRFCGDGVHEAGEGEDCDDGNASCGSCDNGCELDLVQATGTITTQDIVVALDGKTLFLEDGLNNPGTGTVFEFDIDGQLNDTSRVRISVSGSGAASVVRDAIIAAVNRVPDLFITAISSGADRVELTNDHPGVFGNVQILGSVFINVNNFTPFSSDGMKDGTGRDCSNGEVCRSGEDCASGRCLDGVCEPSLCGNGVIDLDAGEQCDDSGRSDRGCDATCRSYAVCGDGVVHSAPGVDEVCDDGNALDCGDCAADCRTALPGSPATGCIKVVDGSAVTDGRVIIVDDGANPATVFELDKDGIVGDADHIPVAISDGQSADEVRDALIAAINGVTADYITAAATGTDLRCGAGAVVHVSHGRATAAGNVRILDDAFIDGFVVHGMDGGVGVGCDVGVGCEADGHCANHACAAGLCADLGGCGDGALQGDEFCDDGNAFQCGACDQACSEERLAEAKGSMSRVPSVQIADGDTLTIDDGVNPVTVFEFDKDGILSDGGHVAIAIANAADDTDVVSAAIVDAVNGVPSLFVQASIGTPPDGVTQILLNHDLQGAVGNRPLRSTADALEVDGMHSGAGRDCPTSVGCLSDDDCGSGICDPSAGSPGVCVESLCGDGVIDPGEQCDDGNGFACGTCSFDCQTIQGSAAAFGVITIVDPTLITDGDTLVINDRVNEPIVFEFDEDGVLDNLLHVPVSLDRLIAGVGDGPEDTRKDDTTLCLDLLDSIVNRAEGLLVAAGLQTNCPEISIENLVPGTTHGAALSIRTQLDGGLSISDVSDGAGHDCIAGTSCQGSDDCASGICDPSTKVCIASSCGDGAQDATEACDDGNALSCGTCAHDCGTAKQDATAIGEISVANPAKIEDGDLLVLGDGLHQPTTFELDKNGGATVGDVMVVVDADAEVTRDNLLQAINGVTGLAIRATAVAADGKRLSLANDNVGAHGNVLIWEVFADSAKAGGGITVEGMEGGVARDCRDGIGCTSASDCSSGVCDASAGRCVACAADGDCAGTEVCTDGVCQAPPLP